MGQLVHGEGQACCLAWLQLQSLKVVPMLLYDRQYSAKTILWLLSLNVSYIRLLSIKSFQLRINRFKSKTFLDTAASVEVQVQKRR